MLTLRDIPAESPLSQPVEKSHVGSGMPIKGGERERSLDPADRGPRRSAIIMAILI